MVADRWTIMSTFAKSDENVNTWKMGHWRGEHHI